MPADRTKKRKAGFMLIVLMMVCVGSGGCGNSSSKDPMQDPKAVTTSSGEVIRYSDTQESVEEILGMETTLRYYKDHVVQGTNGTVTFFRETDGEYRMVYIQIMDPSYTAYQGIKVGDQWEDVRDRLTPDLIDESFIIANLLLDDGKQIDAKIDRDEWEEDWLVLSFVYDDEGIITTIYIQDVQETRF